MRRYACLVAVLIAAPALAQDENATVITTGESAEYGTHLTDELGQAVYLFTADKAAGDDMQMTCTGSVCVGAWPAVTTDAEPKAEGEARQELLGTIDANEQTVVTYNGWPLYYHNADEGEAGPRGQGVESFGGTWSLVTPSGERVGG